MGGFFGAVSHRDVTLDVFFGVDYQPAENLAGQNLITSIVPPERAAMMYAALEDLPFGWNNATNDCVNTAFLGTLSSDIYVAQDSLIKGEFTPEQAADYVQSNLDTFLATLK